MISAVIAGVVRKKTPVKTVISNINIHTMMFYDHSGLRVFPVMDRIPATTSLYVVRQAGEAAKRAVLILNIR